jgi:hypothetical protein
MNEIYGRYVAGEITKEEYLIQSREERQAWVENANKRLAAEAAVIQNRSRLSRVGHFIKELAGL